MLRLRSLTAIGLALSAGALVGAVQLNLTASDRTPGGTQQANGVLAASAAKTGGDLTVNASPPSSTLLPGEIATWTITTKVTGTLSGAATFAVSGAPVGAVSTFSPTTAAVGSVVKLDVATSTSTPVGSYPLTITARVGTTQATVSVTLVVTTSGKDFTISSPPVTLAGPGASTPLDLGLFNPNSQALSITNLTATVSSVSKVAAGTCTTADYAIQQYSGNYPVVVNGRSSTSLSAVAASSLWPRLVMVNRNADQSGCKGATVQLTFTGAGHS